MVWTISDSAIRRLLERKWSNACKIKMQSSQSPRQMALDTASEDLIRASARLHRFSWNSTSELLRILLNWCRLVMTSSSLKSISSLSRSDVDWVRSSQVSTKTATWFSRSLARPAQYSLCAAGDPSPKTGRFNLRCRKRKSHLNSSNNRRSTKLSMVKSALKISFLKTNVWLFFRRKTRVLRFTSSSWQRRMKSIRLWT